MSQLRAINAILSGLIYNQWRDVVCCGHAHNLYFSYRLLSVVWIDQVPSFTTNDIRQALRYHNRRNKELGIRNKAFNLSDIGYIGTVSDRLNFLFLIPFIVAASLGHDYGTRYDVRGTVINSN